ncbi:glycosyltransferase [Alteraurantiacibacter aquimixticola]|uniref:Glycosyltransferase n=1 Tax=Alteraurantiacibacter aquimixticola TaxID=2489173 RepID=A0A4T3F7Y1_9SPHN|nr:glycosyltransferase [Alteraurantiacibacter aquimixticola]TIX51110.1 glycosyltransferase [Alteraurantiacibacter aquimixticola]
MRIVDVCGFYTPEGGGIRTYVEQKLRVAEKLGQDITLLAPGAADRTVEISGSARIVTLASPHFPLDRKYFSFADQAAVHAALDRLQPDLIEASSPWNSANYVAAYPQPVPRALVMHSEPLSAHVYRWFEGIAQPASVDRVFDWFWERLRRYGRSFDAVIAANSSLAQRLSDGGVANVVTMPMGVEPGLFSPALRSESLRERLLGLCQLGPEATLLVSAGRLATEKRVPMLVEAATIAGAHRPIGLVIFGEGRAHRKIMRAIAGNPHIRLLRPVRDRKQFAAILASADALLHGCEAETFGMIAAEAHASGLPLIAPNLGGASDFVRHNPALGFTPTNMADIVRAILQLPDGGLRAAASPPPRNMEEHFRDLFRLYSGLVPQKSAAAA